MVYKKMYEGYFSIDFRRGTMQKRPCEEIFLHSKQQRMETPLCNEMMNDTNIFMDLPSTSDLPITEPVITKKPSRHISDNTNSHLKDFIDDFFKDFQHTECSNISTSFVEPMPQTTEACPSTLAESTNVSHKSTVYRKELGNLIFLTLKLHNRQYYVNIREFNSQEIPTKNGVSMDISSWYEFQYKIFAFNLKYKSSSFIANNTILVLNSNNAIMSIKNLKNYSHIDLSDQHLENLKEIAYDLNDKLIQHMFTIHLPYLIKHKCSLGNVSPEKELMFMSKLILAIEDNLTSILNRIYECNSCVLEVPSQSLHQCFLFNTREKFQQLGNMILMLVNLDFVASVFSNGMDCISKQFLSNINVYTISDVLFKKLN